jgi:glycosyltransferase involved in cell wall biosynthesis
LKDPYHSTPLISIVTIVYNGAADINATLKSVLEQNYSNIQYIIIDGGSTDDTLRIIDQYKNQIDIIVSEPDNGIYDAMNKGISYCKGQWVNFMNCGDTFYSAGTLETVFTDSSNRKSDVIYGKHEVSYVGKKILKIPNPINELWKGMSIQHQSIFVRTEILSTFLFDTRYRFAADYNLLYYFYKNGIHITFIDTFISTVAAQGFSESNSVKTYREFRDIALKYENGAPHIHKYYRRLLLNRQFISIFKKLFPFTDNIRLLFK